MKRKFVIPVAAKEVLLHACCAPCSTAIVEWMLAHDLRPVIYFFNPNIYPYSEYKIRRDESKRHASSLGLDFIEGDYDHEAWLKAVAGLENEPERGARCLQCFKYRLQSAALCTQKMNMKVFTTTLASSRWKSLEQVAEAGHYSERMIEQVEFWAQNWRKGGLSERRAALIREYAFYVQRYCGCEFSISAGHQPVSSLGQES